MKKHYRVQSVLLSSNKTMAVTMSPVEWVLPDPTAGADDDGFPNGWVDAEPEDEGAEPYEPPQAGTPAAFRTRARDFAPSRM